MTLYKNIWKECLEYTTFRKDKQNKITTFYLDSEKDLQKWIYQNKGEYLEFCEGCLLDNFLLSCKNGTALVSEHYVNSNMSNYKIEFTRDLETACKLEENILNWIDGLNNFEDWKEEVKEVL